MESNSTDAAGEFHPMRHVELPPCDHLRGLVRDWAEVGGCPYCRIAELEQRVADLQAEVWKRDGRIAELEGLLNEWLHSGAYEYERLSQLATETDKALRGKGGNE